MTEGRYRAFISYSHSDKRWGEWLHRKLEGYRTPSKIIGRETDIGPIPRRLIPIFRDRDELATSHDLGAEIQAALKESMFLLVVCSPAATRSKWVNEELKHFKALHGETRVRAVIVEGEPFSGDPSTECFPEALRFRVDETGAVTNEKAEPIAADLRPGGDGKKYALSKLVAGLIGARLDDLIQREQARRNARMRAVAGGMAVLVIVLSGLTIEALRQRDAAQVAQVEAESARDQAEELVEFMLTDLRKTLDGVGRLDALDSVGERALAYYDARDLERADADSLGRRARAQLLVGEVDNQLGDLDSALVAYERAAATTEEQLRRDGDNPERIFDHSQSVFWVGYIAWQRGDAETARHYFTQYYDQAKRLVEIDPDNEDYRAELMYAHSNLGTLEMDQNDAERAETHFRDALASSISLYGEKPTAVGAALEVGQSYSWLGEALLHQGKISDAMTARRRELDLYASASEDFQNNTLLRKRRLIAQFGLAEILLASGRVEAARDEALKSVSLSESLLKTDPENLEFVDRAARARTILGEMLFHMGEYEEARKELNTALSLGSNLMESDSSVVQWRARVVANPMLLLARVEREAGNEPAAKKLLDETRSSLEELISENDADVAARRIYFTVLNEQAELSESFLDNYDEIVSALNSNADRHGPKTITLLAHALASIERAGVAAPLTAQLYRRGYRHPEFMSLLTDFPALHPET